MYATTIMVPLTYLISATDDPPGEASRQRDKLGTIRIDPYVLVRDIIAEVVVDEEGAPRGVGVCDLDAEPAAVHIAPGEDRRSCAVPLMTVSCHHSLGIIVSITRLHVLAAPEIARLVARERRRWHACDGRDVETCICASSSRVLTVLLLRARPWRHRE